MKTSKRFFAFWLSRFLFATCRATGTYIIKTSVEERAVPNVEFTAGKRTAQRNTTETPKNGGKLTQLVEHFITLVQDEMFDILQIQGLDVPG